RNPGRCRPTGAGRQPPPPRPRGGPGTGSRKSRGGPQGEHDLSVDLADRIDAEGLLLGPFPRAEIKFARVEGADDHARADDALGKRGFLLRAAVLRGVKLPVALPEDGDFLSGDDEAEALAVGDLVDRPQLHG